MRNLNLVARVTICAVAMAAKLVVKKRQFALRQRRHCCLLGAKRLVAKRLCCVLLAGFFCHLGRWQRDRLQGQAISLPGRALPPEKRVMGMVFQDSGALSAPEALPDNVVSFETA